MFPTVKQDFVRMEGLEPPRPKALDPKSSAATNYATSAFYYAAQIYLFLIIYKKTYCFYPCLFNVVLNKDDHLKIL